MAIIPELDPGKEVSYEDMKLFTNDFSRDNFFGRSQHGILYRGKIPHGWRGTDSEQDITIKMWSTVHVTPTGQRFHSVSPSYLFLRMKDEIRFVGQEFLKDQYIVGKVTGYCFEEEKWGVIFDLKPLGSLESIISDKDKFGWENRVKLILRLARFLELCHGSEPIYLMRNLSASNIVVDKDFNPVLVDFTMILGGNVGDDRLVLGGVPLTSCGYADTSIFPLGWDDRVDVYMFGIILLEVIMKCTSHDLTRNSNSGKPVYVPHVVACFVDRELSKAEKGGRGVKFQFVDKLLQEDPDYVKDDGFALTNLGLSCLYSPRHERPGMMEVVSNLEKLHTVTKHALNCSSI